MYSIPIGLYVSYILLKKLVGKYLRWSALIPLALLVGLITALIMTTLSALFALFFSYLQEALFRPDISRSMMFTLLLGLAIYPVACLIMLPLLRKQFIKKQLLKRVNQQQISSVNIATTNDSMIAQQDQNIALDKIAENYKNKHAAEHELYFQDMKLAYADMIQDIADESLFEKEASYREAFIKETGSILYTLFEYSLHSANNNKRTANFDSTLSAEIMLGNYWIPFILTQCQLEHTTANKKFLMDYFLAPSSNKYRIIFAKIIKHDHSKESDSELSQLNQKLYYEYLQNCVVKNNVEESLFLGFEHKARIELDNYNSGYNERIESFSKIILGLYKQVSGV